CVMLTYLVRYVLLRLIGKHDRIRTAPLIARRGDRAAGLQVLRLIEPSMPEAGLLKLADSMTPTAHTAAPFWTRQLRVPILLAILVSVFNQLSGINAVNYFAPRIFALAGLEEKAALLQSVGIRVVNILFTLLGLLLIDKLGRRGLLYVGSVGYIASLGLTSWRITTGTTPSFPAASSSSSPPTRWARGPSSGY
ncbi:MAG: MFS transporter, partial [Paludibaculum sp.]